MWKGARGAQGERERERREWNQTADSSGVHRSAKRHIRVGKRGEKGGDSSERIQHKYCPRPNGVDPAALPRGRVSYHHVVSFSPWEDSSTTTTIIVTTTNNRVIGILVSPSPGQPPPPSSPPPLLTGSDRHRHHRGTIAIAAKTNKTRRKAVANVAGEKKALMRERVGEGGWTKNAYDSRSCECSFR